MNISDVLKRISISYYYGLLMILEDAFGGIEAMINNHRKRIDKKYWPFDRPEE